MITIGFTGHRPDKLDGYYLESNKNVMIKWYIINTVVELLIERNIKDVKFICGGALGTDQIAFEAVDIIKNHKNLYKLDNVIVETALPFRNQYLKWSQVDIDRWISQLKRSDIITKVDKLNDYKINGYKEDTYYPAKMQKRNEYIVNNSDIVIAIWDDTKGGTANCVKYAQKQKKEIIIKKPLDIWNEYMV